MEFIPANSYELIDLLDLEFPDRCIAPGETPEAAHRRAGARSVVAMLLRLRVELEDNALESPVIR